MSLIFNNIDKMSFDDLGEESEFIPLMTSEDEEALEKENLPEVLPILPLTNTVLFPGVVIPINAGRDKSIKLINDANKSNKLIGVIAQKDFNGTTMAQMLNSLFISDAVLRSMSKAAIDAAHAEATADVAQACKRLVTS